MGGISVESAQATETGFHYDRFWMLVNTTGDCLTQRDFPQMALFQIRFVVNGIEVSFQGETITIPFESASVDEIHCQIWEDNLQALKESKEISNWFSNKLGAKVYLVRMAQHSVRYVKKHAPSKVHFPDSAPYLVLGQQSLHQLNDKLADSVAMNRFRPNIVFTGEKAHEEDQWQHVRIGTLDLESTKLCSRCTVTTIDQITARRGEEPLLSLSKYRLKDKKILFGHYFKPTSDVNHKIILGDTITVLKSKF